MTAPAPVADQTLDDIRALLAPLIATNAAFDGWTGEAVRSAAREAGVDEDVAVYAFGGGAMAMIDTWIDQIDLAMAKALPAERLAGMKVRDRITALVRFRLDAVRGCEEAVRSDLAIMAMPHNAPRGLRLGWRSADRMWRLAGDTATDWNHYTKRSILAGVYTATLAVFIDDTSEGKAESLAFLDRRIEGVMRFEKAKAKLVRPREERFSMARFLGRLRYPAN
jgi:ubiquinone biosynthesis protein COQ9